MIFRNRYATKSVYIFILQVWQNSNSSNAQSRSLTWKSVFSLVVRFYTTRSTSLLYSQLWPLKSTIAYNWKLCKICSEHNTIHPSTVFHAAKLDSRREFTRKHYNWKYHRGRRYIESIEFDWWWLDCVFSGRDNNGIFGPNSLWWNVSGRIINQTALVCVQEVGFHD